MSTNQIYANLTDISVSKPSCIYKGGHSHKGSIYLGIMGFTNRHLSLAERATILEGRYPGVSPSPSSVGRGIYSVDGATKSPASSSPSSCLEIDDGCGRRKKYAKGRVNGRTS